MEGAAVLLLRFVPNGRAFPSPGETALNINADDAALAQHLTACA